jgi:uncharacterized protein YidB (DUF937 family)
VGLFDEISGLAGNALGGGTSSGGDGMAGDLMGVLQQHGMGDMSGLMSAFQQSGMGEHVASWIGDGQNLPISPDQIESALGTPAVAAIAAKFGVDPEQAKQLLSQHLPNMVAQAATTDPSIAPAADDNSGN